MLQQRSSSLALTLSSSFRRSLLLQTSSSAQRCRRAYRIHADASSRAKIQDIDPTKLSITKTTTPKDLLPPKELIFGHNFTGMYPLRPASPQLTNRLRSYAIARMDRITRLATCAHHPLSESKLRPRHLRLPLCIRMLRGDEGIQRRGWTH